MGNSREGLEWLEVCAHLRLRYVIVVHGVYETLWPEDSLADAMARLFLGAAACCFVSHRNWELLEDEIAISLPNAEVVCNPVNLASGAAPAWPPDQPCWRLACVGRLEPHTKAQDLIFKALVDPRWQQRNLKIACYGSGEHFGRGVRRLAERYAPRQIEFHGHVGDVAQIWAANHGLVMPSRCEGMPLALVEAMLCSRMAVVTDVGGHTELVQHGVNGFVAAAPTVALVDQALEESWQCRNRWREMGVAARNSVVTAMPTDPAAVFAQRLIALAHTGRTRS
jgi:glycosyltransferase involved in cell wall biosynthesis